VVIVTGLILDCGIERTICAPKGTAGYRAVEWTRLIPPPLSDAPTPTVGVDSTDTETIHDAELIRMVVLRTCSSKDKVMSCLK